LPATPRSSLRAAEGGAGSTETGAPPAPRQGRVVSRGHAGRSPLRVLQKIRALVCKGPHPSFRTTLYARSRAGTALAGRCEGARDDRRAPPSQSSARPSGPPARPALRASLGRPRARPQRGARRPVRRMERRAPRGWGLEHAGLARKAHYGEPAGAAGAGATVGAWCGWVP